MGVIWLLFLEIFLGGRASVGAFGSLMSFFSRGTGINEVGFGFITLMKRVLLAFLTWFRFHYPYEAGSDGFSYLVSVSSPL
jgi:hypothetical protein